MTSYAMTQSYTEVADEALARAACAGDTAAFGLLVERHRRPVFAYALARLGNQEEAEDAAQEAFVRAFSSLAVFDPSARFAPYLMRILRNHCNDLLRRRRVRHSAPLNSNHRSEEPSPEDRAFRMERIAALLKKAELVSSTRGAHGGYRLAREPQDIRVWDVVIAMEGSVAPVGCLDGGECERLGLCPTETLWQDVEQAIYAVLSQHTLRDLIERQERIEQGQLLQLQALG